MVRITFFPASLCLAGLVASGCATTADGQAESNLGRRSGSSVGGGDGYLAKCNGKVRNLEAVLAPIVSNMVAQRIPHAQEPSNEWRDSSGNFLRLSSYLAAACPDQQSSLVAPAGVRDYEQGGNNVAPDGGKVAARTTRALAEWYHGRGNFTPVFYDGAYAITDVPASLKAVRNRIRPGAVLWFSRGAPTSAGGLEALFNNNSAGTQINHMGIVTKIERNAEGNVVRYHMYQGRSRGKEATVTTHHYWVWPKAFVHDGKAYPSFGDWSQRLVGIATIIPTVRR